MNEQGVMRVVEFIAVFGVFMLLVSVFFNAVTVMYRPPIIDRSNADLAIIAERLVSSPGEWYNATSGMGNTTWEGNISEIINRTTTLTLFGLCLNNNTIPTNTGERSAYGILSKRKIDNLSKALTESSDNAAILYNRARTAFALDAAPTIYHFNITIVNVSSDGASILEFTTKEWQNVTKTSPTYTWKRIVVVYDEDADIYSDAKMLVLRIAKL